MRTHWHTYIAATGAAGLLALGTGASATAKTFRGLTLGGHVDGTVAVTEKHTTCHLAREVAAGYIASSHGSHGFTCRRHSIQAAAGFYATCTASDHRFVQITPE